MTATQAPETMSKGDFARLINVSPARISQYISSGQIGPDALDGTGRAARIIVDRAKRQLNGRLDVGQRLGLNGMTTRVASAPKVEAELPLAPMRHASDAVADEIALEKLAQAKMQTAKARREEALASGRYIHSDEARAEINRAVAMAYRVMEGGLVDMATMLAGHLALPQRDILHHLQRGFNDVRERAAQGFRQAADAEATTIVDDEAEEAE